MRAVAGRARSKGQAADCPAAAVPCAHACRPEAELLHPRGLSTGTTHFGMRPAVARLLLSAANSPDYGQRFVPAAAQPQRGDLEAACEVRRAAGTKGRGVFAAEPMEAGRWVCRYAGKVVTDGSSPPFDPLGLMPDRASTANLELVDTASEYVLELCPGLFIDAKDSSHFSRFVNHAEHGAPGGSRGLRLGSGCRAQRLQPWARGEPREPGGVCRASPRTCLLFGQCTRSRHAQATSPCT